MIVRGGGQSAGGTFLESRFAPAHHNSWRGPLGASQFPQAHLENPSSAYHPRRPTWGGWDRYPGLPWRNHLSTRPTFRCCIRIDRPRVLGFGKLLNQGLIVV